MKLIFLMIISLIGIEVNCARILGVFPMPSISHQLVFKAFIQALSKRGHELVIITANPTLTKDRPADNITEIDIGKTAYDEFGRILTSTRSKGLTKLGFIYDAEAYTFVGTVPLFSTICSEQFKLSEVKQIIDDKTQHFDLIIMESIIEYPLILSKIFKAPVIYFSSFYGTSENYATMGTIDRHPFLYPQSHRSNFGGVSFWEKLQEIYWDWKVTDFYRKVKENSNRLLKENFGLGAPTIDELRENVQMMFLNLHPMFDNNRPVPPSVIYLGALHLQPVKKLPEDILSILEKSKHGVIYVSFGTIIRPSDMSRELLNIFFDAFKTLPYDIIWKFDADELDNKPDNVIIKRWLPQRDLLMHPKVKAFVSQGGLQSIDEAIDADVPIVGIPMVADQWFNLHQSTKMGISIKLDAMTLNPEELCNSIKEVIENKSYKKNIRNLRLKMRDQPQNPMDRAIWWTEHVLRHGGAKHLRSPTANISWSEYLALDVLIPVLILIALTIIILIHFILNIIRCFVSHCKVNVKIS